MSQVPDLHAPCHSTEDYSTGSSHPRIVSVQTCQGHVGFSRVRVVGRVQEVRGAWEGLAKGTRLSTVGFARDVSLKGWAGLSYLRGLIHSTLNKKNLSVFMLMFKYLLKIKISKILNISIIGLENVASV